MPDQPTAGPIRLPGEGLDAAKMPAHWLFARLGKRVLRPGGSAFTKSLLESLAIGPNDDIVEMAPGLGATTRLLIQQHPATYTGIERDRDAAHLVQHLLPQPQYICRVGTAQATGLTDCSTDVVFGEAFLTMQPESVKRGIAAEIFRILEPGGRYGLHELAFQPGTSSARQDEIRSHLASTLHVGARPLTIPAWQHLLEDAGFQIDRQTTAPFRLLQPRQVIRDEGPARAARIFATAATQPAIRARMKEIRACFLEHEHELCAVGLIAHKP